VVSVLVTEFGRVYYAKADLLVIELFYGVT
jgi:hypothetical protein